MRWLQEPFISNTRRLPELFSTLQMGRFDTWSKNFACNFSKETKNWWESYRVKSCAAFDVNENMIQYILYWIVQLKTVQIQLDVLGVQGFIRIFSVFPQNYEGKQEKSKQKTSLKNTFVEISLLLKNVGMGRRSNDQLNTVIFALISNHLLIELEAWWYMFFDFLFFLFCYCCVGAGRRRYYSSRYRRHFGVYTVLKAAEMSWGSNYAVMWQKGAVLLLQNF